MKLLTKLMLWANIFAFATSILIFCFPTSAMADTSADNNALIKAIGEKVRVVNGKFSVKTPPPGKKPTIIPSPGITIGSAIVSLPKGETGTIDKLVITRKDGAQEIREFGCSNLKIQNGTDLIQSCGGLAALKPGETIYEAQGSDFKPNPNVTLSISLVPLGPIKVPGQVPGT